MIWNNRKARKQSHRPLDSGKHRQTFLQKPKSLWEVSIECLIDDAFLFLSVDRSWNIVDHPDKTNWTILFIYFLIPRVLFVGLFVCQFFFHPRTWYGQNMPTPKSRRQGRRARQRKMRRKEQAAEGKDTPSTNLRDSQLLCETCEIPVSDCPCPPRPLCPDCGSSDQPLFGLASDLTNPDNRDGALVACCPNCKYVYSCTY